MTDLKKGVIGCETAQNSGNFNLLFNSSFDSNANFFSKFDFAGTFLSNKQN